jgi:pyridoxal phosphate phosphatase PHOSPHO2
MKHPAMVRGITALKQAGKTTFFCLSDSNSIFISTILKDKGLDSLFAEIITNPAEWDGELLRVHRWIDPDGPQHNCKIGCPPNICKGKLLARALNVKL